MNLDGLVLKMLNDDIRCDPEMIGIALNQNGMAFQFIHKQLKNKQE